jgi:peptidyl-prolyl cis-trans isomerase C
MADKVRASHILVSTDGRDKETALAAINDIKSKVDGGEAFADLAREHSDCPSGADGGDLGAFGRGAMVAEFDKAAFELDVDKVSDVVETAFGYHIIHRTE